MVSDKQLDKAYPKQKKWIKGAVKHPGALHEALGIPEGEKISSSKLAVKPDDSTRMKRMKNLAKTFRKF